MLAVLPLGMRGKEVDLADAARAPRLPIGRGLRIVALALFVCIAIAGLVAAAWGWSAGITIERVEAAICAWGAWGAAASFLLMVLHSFVPFPAEIVAFANGMCFGPLWGTVVTWGGAMAGAAVAFGLARVLGRPFVEGLLARRDWHAIDAWTAREGWQVVFLARFTPVIAFNLVNYAAGLSAISWWTFGWTTAIGILPLTVLMVVLGDRAEALSWPLWLFLFGTGVAIWALIRLRVRRRSTNAAEPGRADARRGRSTERTP